MKKIFTILTMTMTALVFTQSVSALESTSLRQSYKVYKSQRGTTTPIPESVIKTLCGDRDGCTLRMGMSYWNSTGNTASRESLFYYNNSNRQWRASRGDKAGRNNNNVTQHVMQAWACYFTDGKYRTWSNAGDFDTNFGLLSWNQYNANCTLTIID